MATDDAVAFPAAPAVCACKPQFHDGTRSGGGNTDVSLF